MLENSPQSLKIAEEENSARKEQEERQAKLEAFRQKLLEDGIDPTELLRFSWFIPA